MRRLYSECASLDATSAIGSWPVAVTLDVGAHSFVLAYNMGVFDVFKSTTNNAKHVADPRSMNTMLSHSLTNGKHTPTVGPNKAILAHHA